ncbi:sensor histidine kinase [Nodosilinea nodulosa]|uniref:sensor histidine kinase n=1 Tax=Nodosilinea nodulosa TaxID=416001 RepID=UPI0002F33575
MEPIEASFQRLKQFTADASHELRGPLMAIASNVELALKYPAESPPPGGPADPSGDYQEVFLSIASATAQLTRLTEDLLLLARSDGARGAARRPSPELAAAPIALSPLLEALMALYLPQAQASAIALQSDIAPDLTLAGNGDHLSRAVANLVQNALQYTPAGGQVWVVAQAQAQQIQITVKDTGIGIAPEHWPQVFERFWRGDAARTHDRGGSGLGLAIAQAIIQDHGGTISLTSQLCRGSCFTVKLPIAEAR